MPRTSLSGTPFNAANYPRLSKLQYIQLRKPSREQKRQLDMTHTGSQFHPRIISQPFVINNSAKVLVIWWGLDDAAYEEPLASMLETHLQDIQSITNLPYSHVIIQRCLEPYQIESPVSDFVYGPHARDPFFAVPFVAPFLLPVPSWSTTTLTLTNTEQR